MFKIPVLWTFCGPPFGYDVLYPGVKKLGVEFAQGLVHIIVSVMSLGLCVSEGAGKSYSEARGDVVLSIDKTAD